MNDLKQIEVNVMSDKNKHCFYLAQYVEYRIDGNLIIFYNTLFDSVLLLPMTDKENSAEMFINGLQKGVDNIQDYICSYFSANWEEVYRVFVQKKIIE